MKQASHKKEILCDSTNARHIINIIETESRRVVVARGRGRGQGGKNTELVFNGYRDARCKVFKFCKMRRILQMGYTTLRIYLTLQSCPLKNGSAG